jgi:hypothetical protein
VLASTGARSVLVDGAGHLAVHQQPVAFAALVHEVWSTATGPSAIDRRNAEDAA